MHTAGQRWAGRALLATIANWHGEAVLGSAADSNQPVRLNHTAPLPPRRYMMLRRFAEQAQDCGAVVFMALGGQQLAHGPVQVRPSAGIRQLAGWPAEWQAQLYRGCLHLGPKPALGCTGGTWSNSETVQPKLTPSALFN